MPLARVVAEHRTLPKFFKRYQIQPVWRADRPARGRFREFYQCDVDVLGSTSPVVEAELCAAAAEALLALGFTDFTIRLNHRQLLTALLEVAGVPADKHARCPDRPRQARQDRAGRGDRRHGGARHRAARRGRRDRAVPDRLPGRRRAVADQRRRVRGAAHESATHAARTGGARQPRARWSACAAATPAGGAAAARSVAWPAGCRTTRARSWRSPCPTSPAASAAADATTTWSACSAASRCPACGFSLGLERILVVMGERGMFPAARRGRAPPTSWCCSGAKRPRPTRWRWRASCAAVTPASRAARRAVSRGRQARQAVQVRARASASASPRSSATTRPGPAPSR